MILSSFSSFNLRFGLGKMLVFEENLYNEKSCLRVQMVSVFDKFCKVELVSERVFNFL